MIEQAILEEVLSNNLELNIRNAFIQDGYSVPNISDFISFISELYKYHPPDKITWKFSCFITTQDVDFSIGTVMHRNNIFNSFNKDISIILINKNMCVVCDYGAVKLTEPYILYVYENRIESILANNKKIPILNPDSATFSIFAKATFKDLDEALRKYYNNRAKFSICPKIEECWLEENRIRFRAGPEHSLRDSLWLYLRDVLRGDPEVKREQSVNDTNPVDIKVIWKWSKAVALIEIKWLGKSFNETTGRKTQAFYDKRAIEGAEQLQNYISMSLAENQDIYFDGYLVIFDARRQRVNRIDNIPNNQQATYYRDKEIFYPDNLRNNPCIKLDYRFFLEPKVS